MINCQHNKLKLSTESHHFEFYKAGKSFVKSLRSHGTIFTSLRLTTKCSEVFYNNAVFLCVLSKIEAWKRSLIASPLQARGLGELKRSNENSDNPVNDSMINKSWKSQTRKAALCEKKMATKRPVLSDVCRVLNHSDMTD